MNGPFDDEIEAGLEFILTHFSAFAFPRTISTKTTQGRQVYVNNQVEALARFKQAYYMDCRINAYSKHDIKGDPNFIFIDIDRTNQKLIDKILNRKLHSIEAHPTVLFTGSGYHIYQPIESVCIDELATFSDFSEPSKQFLKFAETYLSYYKCDPNHNPSFKSCMVRIPNSINSKNGLKVKIVQAWDGKRPNIILLLGSFYARILTVTEQKKQQDKLTFVSANQRTNPNLKQFEIKWIETLLQTSIDDYRKNAIALILSPYVINIRKMSYVEASLTLKNWLTKCNASNKLIGNFEHIVKYSLKCAIRNRRLPMKFDTLKFKNPALHAKLLVCISEGGGSID